MFENSQTYNTSANSSAVNNGMFVLRACEPVSEYKPQKFIATVLMSAFMGVLSLQAGFVLNANAQNSPVSSPVASAVTCPSGTVTKIVNSIIVCINQNQNQNQNQNNNQTNPGTSGSSWSTPITAPEQSASPSASVSPISYPETSPSGNPISYPELPNQTVNTDTSASQGNGGSSSNNSGGSVSAPSCDNEAPKSAPKIISAVTSGKNQITLTWEKAQGPVTNYVIAYGLVKGKPMFGNPNVGNVTSYTVKGLSGGFTYFFKVRASNDCKPGEYSQEIGVKVGGKFINAPAQNFQPGVLGKATQSGKIEPKSSTAPVASTKPAVSEINNPQVNLGLVGKVLNFFKGFFKP